MKITIPLLAALILGGRLTITGTAFASEQVVSRHVTSESLPPGQRTKKLALWGSRFGSLDDRFTLVCSESASNVEAHGNHDVNRSHSRRRSWVVSIIDTIAERKSSGA